jgi:hypothetical protein
MEAASRGIRKTVLHRRRFVYPVLLLLEALIFHRRVLFYPGFAFPWDFRGVHVPLAAFVAGSLRRGEWPLWDPFTYCGVPIYANIQTALFYPPVFIATLAAAWLGDGVLPRLLAIAIVLQTVFAGVCTFALVRRIGGAPGAAWIAATVYELGCFFAAQPEHIGAMQGAAWLPLVWWCVIELREKTTRFWTALLAFAFSMTILAGLPQVAVAAFFSAVLLALFLWRPLLPVLLSCGWSLLLAAVQLAPTTELMRHGVAKYRVEWLGGGGGIPVGALASLVIPNYWSVFDPAHFHGPVDLTFLYLYSSLLGLALALAAMFWKPDRWARSFAALNANGAAGDARRTYSALARAVSPLARQRQNRHSPRVFLLRVLARTCDLGRSRRGAIPYAALADRDGPLDRVRSHPSEFKPPHECHAAWSGARQSRINRASARADRANHPSLALRHAPGDFI